MIDQAASVGVMGITCVLILLLVRDIIAHFLAKLGGSK